MKLFAMVSPQGTCCLETLLREDEYAPERRAQTEREYCKGRRDDPVAGSWTDVSDNDAAQAAME